MSYFLCFTMEKTPLSLYLYLYVNQTISLMHFHFQQFACAQSHIPERSFVVHSFTLFFIIILNVCKIYMKEQEKPRFLKNWLFITTIAINFFYLAIITHKETHMKKEEKPGNPFNCSCLLSCNNNNNIFFIYIFLLLFFFMYAVSFHKSKAETEREISEKIIYFFQLSPYGSVFTHFLHF